MRRLLAFLVVALVTWFVVRLQQPDAPTVGSSDSPAASAPNASARDASIYPTTSPTSPNKGFRDREHLADHYAKHGNEFPGLSQAEYLARAQALRDAPAGGDILEVIRTSDGVISRFDKRSGAFIAFDRDGTIRTFFKPNDGERYFRRQANRVPSR